VEDKRYGSTQTMSAASFSDYANKDGKATGASVTYNRLVTLKVTDLKANDASAGKDNLAHIESVMSWIDTLNGKKEYAQTMFKVVIPKGTYYIDGRYTSTTSRCIHLYSNTWLSMNGVTLIKSDTRNRAMIRAGKSSKSYSGYGGENNIILEGGVIDGNTRIHKSKSQHYSGVRFGHDHDILIANVDFKGNVCGHHLELCGVKGISVVGCSFTDYKNTGYTKGINRNEAIQIDVTNSSNLTPTYKSYDDTLSGNVVIYGNKFENLSRGVGSHSAVFGKYYDDIVIENNSFEDVKSQAVHCENYRNCSISGNTIKNCGGGIDFNAICYAPDGNYYRPHGSLAKYDKIKSYNAKTVINGNKIAVKKGSSLKNASGIYVHGGKASSSRTKSEVKPYYKKTFRITGVTIKGNKITRARSSGVFLSYVGNYKISDNKVSNITSGSAARGMGLYLDHCSSGTIQSNKISKTKSHGVYLLSSTGSSKKPMTVYDNDIDVTKNTGCIGVYLKDSKCAEVTKNNIDARSYGVYLSKSSTVTVGERNGGNTMSSSAKYGVYATGKSKSGIFVQYNWISSKQEATHAASGSKITASGNVVKVKS
jgi:parallel beta-helix repeat protein